LANALTKGKKMNAKSKLLLMILSGLLVSTSGCVSYGKQHLLNDKAVYTSPPEGIAINDGGLLYGEGKTLTRIKGASTIPAGWLIVPPEK
jgi:hypothetical protein